MTDLITISAAAGNGGRGHVSFRRTKQVTKGGPDGGNGGNGGDVIVEAMEDVRDLKDFKGKAKFVAGIGGNGGANGLDGKRGEDLILKVPVGTIIRRYGADGAVEADLDVHGDRVTILSGGIGGRGNRSFASSKNRTPILAEAGEPGETSEIELEYRTDSDLAILGGTQVGKSRLLNMLTNTGVGEREYPYSTPEPVVGTVPVRGKDRKVIEIPGLFREGEGKLGPGVKALRHAEKAAHLVLLVQDIETESKRLKQIFSYNWPSLLSKPSTYISVKKKTNKFDVYSKDRVRLQANISAEMLKDFLLSELSKSWTERRTEPKHFDMSRLKNRERIQKEEPHVETQGGQYILRSTLAEMLVKGTDLNTWEAQAQFKGQLRDWKLGRLIEAQGIKEGDELKVAHKVIKW